MSDIVVNFLKSVKWKDVVKGSLSIIGGIETFIFIKDLKSQLKDFEKNKRGQAENELTLLGENLSRIFNNKED